MRTNVTMPRGPHEAGRAARNAATSKWMSILARFGYAVKGIVYLIIGWLAIELAVGHGGSTTDQRGALHTIYDQPFGNFLLVVAIVGLVGFALWCFIQALFDTEGKGSDAKGIIARVGYAIVGIAYGGLAYGAFQLVTGTGNGGKSSTAQAQSWTALLLKQPLGVALVVIVGLVILGVAGYLYFKAYSAKFQYRLNLASVRAQMRRLFINLGRFGYAALGVVFTIIGIFMVVAALQYNPKDATGLDGALQKLLHQSFGPLLLGVVALGLIAYGIYSFVEARYRRVGRG